MGEKLYCKNIADGLTYIYYVFEGVATENLDIFISDFDKESEVLKGFYILNDEDASHMYTFIDAFTFNRRFIDITKDEFEGSMAPAPYMIREEYILQGDSEVSDASDKEVKEVKEVKADVLTNNTDLYVTLSTESVSDGYSEVITITKVMEVEHIGCLVHITTRVGLSLSTTSTLIPNTKIYDRDDGTKYIGSR